MQHPNEPEIIELAAALSDFNEVPDDRQKVLIDAKRERLQAKAMSQGIDRAPRVYTIEEF